MVDLGRIRLFFTSPGPADAPALLLVHGWGGDGRVWSPHVEAPAGRFRVVVPDLRGHGRSEVPAEGNTPVETAADLAALIDALGTGPVVAVGHSRGGQVVNLPAVHHPHTVRTVIELDPAHGAHGEEAEQIPDYRARGSRAAADFVAGAFAPDAPAGLRTAHVRAVLGTPDHVIARSYAGMYTDPGAVGVPAQRAVPAPPRPAGADRMDVGRGRRLGTRHPARARLTRRPLAGNRALPPRGTPAAYRPPRRGLGGLRHQRGSLSSYSGWIRRM